jgi:hypothetical protein
MESDFILDLYSLGIPHQTLLSRDDPYETSSIQFNEFF